jgi:hypothetical protein
VRISISWCMTIVLLAGLGAGQARAQQDKTEAEAEQLFLQGRALMEQGDFDQACRALEASHKLDPALGTLLNLALCNEKRGKVASAWALYREVEDLARRESQKKRADTARERARALQAELPRLLIAIAAQGRVPGLTIERDGLAVDTALLGQAVYVDPGVHRIVARAPGYMEWVAEIKIAKGEQATVEIPVLQAGETETSGQDAVKDVRAPGPDEKAASGPGDDRDASEQDAVKDVRGPDGTGAAGPGDDGGASGKPGNTRRIVGLGVGGAGVAAMAVGLGFGWSARSTWNDAFSSGLCDADALTCMTAGQKQTNTARSRALVSNILVGAGVTLAAAGVVLYVTAPKRAESAGITVVPVAGPRELGVAVQGGF